MHTQAAITDASFALIRQRLAADGFTFEPDMAAVVERIIHSTADFEFAHITRISLGALDAGIAALRAGAPIVTDVQMVRVGISAPRLATFGVAVHCFVADDIARQRAAAADTTRSAIGIRIAAECGLLAGGITVIGNAPTALFETIRLIDEGVRPALVIGVPVGFVGTTQSKEALTQVTDIPWIITEGCKGGSTVAVAIVNALLRLAMGASPTEVDRV
jgi:precorrin-8X/cobalt-precorrin-8 methylmutase